jgi:hypothetical protein
MAADRSSTPTQVLSLTIREVISARVDSHARVSR